MTIRAALSTRAFVILVFVVVPLVVVSVAVASTTAHNDTRLTPKQQIAQLKEQVRALRLQVGDLNREVSFLTGRVTALQAESAAIPQLAEIAAATARYRDLANALADGYVHAGAPCLPNAGIHYGKGGWAADNVIDLLQPDFLMYSPSGKLVAVEYAVPTRFPRPTLFGQPFFEYTGGPGEPIWYLHVWLWQLNPEGTLAEFNRYVEC